MIVKLRILIGLFRVVLRWFHFFQHPTISSLLTAEEDLRDLSVGRWATYKDFYLPALKINLTRDMEAILRVHSFYAITGGEQATGQQLVEQTDLMVKICNSAIKLGTTMTEDFIVLQIAANGYKLQTPTFKPEE